MTKTVHLLLIIFFPFLSFAQGNDVKISGRVIDELTQEPVIGASVLLVNAKGGVVSNAGGNFSLNVKSLPVTISVEYLGYKKQEVNIYEYTGPIIVQLRESVNSLNEIVVVGYGTQKRKELTGAIASVPSAVLSQQAVSFDQFLGGAVAGLSVTQTSGAPGATSTIRIRGSNSIAAKNEPLYVIDGYILYNDNSVTRTNVGGTTSGVGDAGTSGGTIDGGLNPLTLINPADIESIDVLKDVSATAIYGSRGANGVIIITTKKGKQNGKNIIKYQGSFGVSSVNKKLDLLHADEWSSLYSELTGNSPYDSSQPYNVNKLLPKGQSEDWQDAIFQTGLTQNHNASVSGGGADYRYLISGSYSNQSGIVRNTDLTRYIGRINIDKDVSKKLNIGANLTVGRIKQTGLTNQGSSSTFDYAVRMSPLVPVHDATSDDGYNYFNPFDASDYRIGDYSVNPVSDLLTSTVETRNISVLGNVYAQYAILPQLVAKLNVGTNLNHATQNFYAPSTSARGRLVNGYGGIGNKDYLSSLAEFTLNYKERFAEIHSVEVLAGYTTEHTEVEFVTAGASGFQNEALTFWNLQSGSTGYVPISGGVPSNLNSVLGRVNYSLLDRYNLTATFRADGSTRFPGNNKWGYFPSVGVSWNIDNEPFFQLKPVSSLKLRVSAGQVGNQEVGDFQYSRLYSPRNYSFSNKIVVGYTATTYGNDQLKWETTTQYNIGVDAGLLNERLHFTLDGYHKNTSDLLVNVPVERTSGLRNQLVNFGNISNRGIEFSVNADIIERRNFQWSVLANISRNINRIEKLQSDITVSDFRIKEGLALGSFYGYAYDGVVQQGEEATTPIPTWTSSVQAGDPKFVNQTGDPNTINEEDKVLLGDIQPDFTYGFSTQVRYKGFDASASFQGSQGNHIYNALRHRLETPSISMNGAAVLAERWTPTHTNTSVPRAIPVPYVTLDSRYIEDASYLRLKDLTLGYTFPKSWIPRTTVRLFASAQNLLTITGYKGYDPEVSRNGEDETNGLLQGIDLGAYPTAKTFLFGLSLTL